MTAIRKKPGGLAIVLWVQTNDDVTACMREIASKK